MRKLVLIVASLALLAGTALADDKKGGGAAPKGGGGDSGGGKVKVYDFSGDTIEGEIRFTESNFGLTGRKYHGRRFTQKS